MHRAVLGGLTILVMCIGLLRPIVAQDLRLLPPTTVETRLAELEAELRALRQATGGSSPSATQTGYALPVEDATNVSHVFDPALDVPAGDTVFSSVAPGPSASTPVVTYPTVKVGGFFQADWGWFGQDATNMATVGDIQDGADFRRTRLNAHGDAWDNIAYMIEMDFAFPGRPTFMDVYFDVKRVAGVGNVRFGQWRQPFGMDAMTSVKELTFLERALPFAFVPFRQIGVGIYDHAVDERSTWALSLFRFPTDTFGGNVGDNGGYSLAGRYTVLPWYFDGGCRLVHFGFNYAFIEPANDVVQYRNQPEFFVSETGSSNILPAGVPPSVPFFVDTGALSVHHSNLFGVEAAAANGPLHAQSEIMFAVIDQVGGSTAVLPGAYAQVGYVLTGEARAYNRTSGVFGRVKPCRSVGNECGPGAWEVAARWSHLDLNDENIQGGRINDLTFGLNWYLNPFTKLQWNYIHAFLDDPTTGKSDADIVAMRGQVDF